MPEIIILIQIKMIRILWWGGERSEDQGRDGKGQGLRF